MENQQMELLLEHYRHPHNFGTLESCCAGHEEGNPSCGDLIRIEINIADDCIADIGFSGRGCTISMAAASILTDRVRSTSIDSVLTLKHSEFLQGLGIPISPIRKNCALLPLVVLKNTIAIFRNEEATYSLNDE